MPSGSALPARLRQRSSTSHNDRLLKRAFHHVSIILTPSLRTSIVSWAWTSSSSYPSYVSNQMSYVGNMFLHTQVIRLPCLFQYYGAAAEASATPLAFTSSCPVAPLASFASLASSLTADDTPSLSSVGFASVATSLPVTVLTTSFPSPSSLAASSTLTSSFGVGSKISEMLYRLSSSNR